MSHEAQILQALGRGSEGIQQLRAAVETDSELEAVWAMLSVLSEREGDDPKALEAAARCHAILIRYGGLRENVELARERITNLQERANR